MQLARRKIILQITNQHNTPKNIHYTHAVFTHAYQYYAKTRNAEKVKSYYFNSVMEFIIKRMIHHKHETALKQIPNRPVVFC